jgi:hypothetical protein
MGEISSMWVGEEQNSCVAEGGERSSWTSGGQM